MKKVSLLLGLLFFVSSSWANCSAYQGFYWVNHSKNKQLSVSINNLVGTGIRLQGKQFLVDSHHDRQCRLPYCMNGQFEILVAGERVCVVSYVAMLDYHCSAPEWSVQPTMEVVRSVGHPRYRCYNSNTYRYVVIK